MAPWGEDWLQVGTISSLLYNAHRGSGAEVLGARDFIPAAFREADDVAPSTEQSVEEQMCIINTLFCAMGGK